jgi:hypothetical protein
MGDVRSACMSLLTSTRRRTGWKRGSTPTMWRRLLRPRQAGIETLSRTCYDFWGSMNSRIRISVSASAAVLSLPVVLAANSVQAELPHQHAAQSAESTRTTFVHSQTPYQVSLVQASASFYDPVTADASHIGATLLRDASGAVDGEGSPLPIVAASGSTATGAQRLSSWDPIVDVGLSRARIVDWIRDLETLTPDWDGEGAPIPTSSAVGMAGNLARWAEERNLVVESIDADVTGGVAVYLRGSRPGRKAWLSILNNGTRSIVLSDEQRCSGHELNDDALNRMRILLEGGDAALG